MPVATRSAGAPVATLFTQVQDTQERRLPHAKRQDAGGAMRGVRVKDCLGRRLACLRIATD
jgi:hypothetical protein